MEFKERVAFFKKPVDDGHVVVLTKSDLLAALVACHEMQAAGEVRGLSEVFSAIVTFIGNNPTTVANLLMKAWSLISTLIGSDDTTHTQEEVDAKYESALAAWDSLYS
jgi:spore maturation protein SpmB